VGSSYDQCSDVSGTPRAAPVSPHFPATQYPSFDYSAHPFKPQIFLLNGGAPHNCFAVDVKSSELSFSL
jgi:hypothetical protein